MSAITTFARQLADADKVFGSAVAEVAKGVAQAFGTDVTFEEWESGAAEFKSAYAAQRGCTEATAANRWSFVCAELKAQYGMEKPKKPTAQAQTKQAQRAKKAEAVDAVLAEHKTMADLTKAMQKAAPAEVKVYADALAKKASETKKEAEKAARERVKALHEAIRENVKGLTLAQLEKVAKLVKSFADENAQEATEEPAGDASEAGTANPLAVVQEASDGPLNAMQQAMRAALAPQVEDALI